MGMKSAHVRDGATLTKFIFWIKTNIPVKKLTELDAIHYLDKERMKNKNFFSLSFPTIAGSGPNGAIVHYRASKKSNRTIKNSDLFLVDSGAQYFDGTTDVTRTIAFSHITKDQKEMYTRVLKGHIALATSQLSSRENGKKLDKLARKYLQEVKKNYDHGTGHGVGSFLNVHEGPQSISMFGKTSFKNGMIVSNEPGYYKKNSYGIRIENLILAKVKKAKLSFETLTLAPLENKLIEIFLLKKNEIKWINNYHSEVRKKLLPFMNKKQSKWLKEETSRITL
jgi:Xaa-Pro aminopeptidase